MNKRSNLNRVAPEPCLCLAGNAKIKGNLMKDAFVDAAQDKNRQDSKNCMGLVYSLGMDDKKRLRSEFFKIGKDNS